MDLLIFAAVLGGAVAMPSYIAVPSDQIAFLDLRALRSRRVPRQTLQPPQPPSLPQALYEDDYQPIPIEQYRQPTVALAPPPEPARIQAQQEAESSQAGATLAKYDERPQDFGEYVDFGAHTGDNGAFGWYADYPISNQGAGYNK
ncbi:unnamed protein product [Leptidea sinapis]|uniref:Uncharacterized protein n=1 Tax=Leptidea sinapis TaxID=189913 RepID=A0A5E4PUJ8_9NEOP|nr:unnamed protein product [Leptidea sinapis]